MGYAFQVIDSMSFMVARAGVQPATFALGVRCSMQLSYRAIPSSVSRPTHDAGASWGISEHVPFVKVKCRFVKGTASAVP